MDVGGYEAAEGKVAAEGNPTYYYGHGHTGHYYRVRNYDDSGEEVSKEEKVDCGRVVGEMDMDGVSESSSDDEEQTR